MEAVVKILMSLALIAWGVFGLIRMRKDSEEQKKKILKQVLANYIIAKDALIHSDLEPACFMDAVDHLTENTIDVVLMACGSKYVQEADWLMKEYDSKQKV